MSRTIDRLDSLSRTAPVASPEQVTPDQLSHGGAPHPANGAHGDGELDAMWIDHGGEA